MEATSERWGFLAPWTALLREHEVRVTTKTCTDYTHRSTFEAIELTMQQSVMEEGDPLQPKLHAMAEAVELVATALALFPEAWSALIIKQCDCSWFNPSLYATGPLAPRFAFNCGFYPGDILVRKTGVRFFEVLMDSTTHRSSAFETAKHRLLAMMDDCSSSSFAPVAITIEVSTWNEFPEHLLFGHVTFVEDLQALRQSSSGSWCSLERISFDITGPEITSVGFERCLELARQAPFVQFDQLTIDPKVTSLSVKDLATLLFVVVWASPLIHLDLGDSMPDNTGREGYFDADGSDTSSHLKIIRMMMTIAHLPVHYKALNIGELMTRAPQERDRRQVVWCHVFGTLLHPTARCTIESLLLNSDRILHVEEDALLIQQAASANPGHKIPSSLTIEATNIHPASLRAIVTAFSPELRHLCIADNQRAVDSTEVSFIVETCTKLKHLTFSIVALDSFEVFYATPCACRLSTLALTNVSLRERRSLQNFLKELGDAQSHLGRSLSEFVFRRSGDDPSKVVLDAHDVFQVTQSLRENGRVQIIRLDVSCNVPEWLVDYVNREHRQPAAVRQAPLAITSKLAFLSAMALRGRPPYCEMSSDVVKLVFDFAAVCESRWINVKKSFPDETS